MLATISKLFNWFATREDDYSSPVVRGMGRAKGQARARTRILHAKEICLLWRASESVGLIGAVAKTALLTAQRRSKVVSMQWADLADGVWTIPSGPREKATAGALRLPPMALSVIGAQPRLAHNPHVFAGRGAGAIVGLSKMKRTLDEKMALANGGEAVSPWVLHDLRRTAKSLMSGGGVSGNAVKLLLHLVKLSQGNNGWGHGGEGGELFLAEREAARAIGVSRNTASRAFAELVEHGFLRVVSAGHFQVKVKRATTWRLTFQPYPRRHQGPTNEYRQWQPEQKSRAQNLTGTGAKTGPNR